MIVVNIKQLVNRHMKIEIKNRYQDTITFKEIEPNIYVMSSVDSKGEAVDYGWRFGFDEVDGTRVFNMVDPPGGPYLSIGDTIPATNKKIKAIDITGSMVLIITE
jgi:hypothetical protein